VLKLTEAELDAGLALVEEHGLSELLPPMFEVPALRYSLKPIRRLMSTVDLHLRETSPALTLIAQKQKYLVRPIHLLDPIDTIFYTALVRRLAPLIEDKRPKKSAKIVFSYRFKKGTKRQFELSTGWRGYSKRANEMAHQAEYVAIADIADFFAHTYLHRLNNALADLTGLTAESALLERWLGTWSPDRTVVSQGLPVGQLASNVLAEGLLVEVDDFLASKGFQFIRYVDDYYFFCQDESSAFEALYELGQRLANVERLGLNAAKTRIIRADKLKEELVSPNRVLQARRDAFIENFLQGDPYGIVDWAALTHAQQTKIDGINADEMLEEALAADIVDLSKVTFALQVLGALRRKGSADLVIKNLAVLGPVSRHVGRFLLALESAGPASVQRLAKRVMKYIEDGRFKTPYQVIWLLDPFTRSGVWDNDDALRRLLKWSDELVQRQALLALSQSPKRSSRQEVRTARNNASSWVQRAALFGWRTLPKDEREHGWPRYRGAWTVEQVMNRAVVEYARSLA